MNASNSPRRISAARRIASLLVWLSFGVLAFTRAGAQTITIVNPSFEDPTVPGGTDFQDGANGWSILNGTTTGAGVFSSSAPPGTTPPAQDGVQMGFANSGLGLVQVLGTTYAANTTYTFTGYIGRRGNETNDEDTTGALRIGTYSGGIFTVLGSQSTTLADGATAFNFVTGSYSTATGGVVGQLIAIAFVNLADAQVVFDDVHLTASPIPEPATMAAWVGAAMLGFVVLRRRAKSS